MSESGFADCQKTGRKTSRMLHSHLHGSAQTKNMTPVFLNGIFDNENIDRVVYPASKEVDFAAIEQHSHRQVTRVDWLHWSKRSIDRTNTMR